MSEESIVAIVVALILAASTIFTGLYIVRAKRKKEQWDPTSLEKSVLFRFSLSEAIRKKLVRSQFISDGQTETELMKLLNLAKKDDTILAMCGTKGNYSKKYYHRTFDVCGSVKRVFSFEAIKDEFYTKGERFALEGLQQHVDWKPREKQVKELFFVREGNLIGNTTDNEFKPPLSFGFAILLRGDKPMRAVLHWETTLTDVINIDGIVVDGGQKELLKTLVLLHGRISESDPVLTFKDNEDELLHAIAKLEEKWRIFILTEEYTDITARKQT